MSPPFFSIKQNDTLPVIQSVLEDASGPIDLTSCTIKFLMRNMDGTGTPLSAVATIDADPTTGIVSYQWRAADTVIAGEYRGEFEVTDTDSNKLTYPSDGYIYITILPDLG